ncbi:hypothetical protein D3C81_706210 [compost metagenome]
MHQVGILELHRRQVDRHRLLAVPAGRLLAGQVQRPVAQFVDQPGFLGDGDEVHGHDHATGRVLPAQQRLIAGNAAGLLVDHRLVVQLQLAQVQRGAQVGFHQAALARGDVQFDVEALVAVAAVALGLVQRHVGVAQQLLGLVAVIRRNGNADAHPHRELVPLDLERRADRVDQALRSVACGLPALQAGQHHGKLVAAQAGQGVVFAQLAAQALAQRAQQFVAKGVAQRIVDVLEVVQVQAQGGGQLGVLAVTHQRLAQAFVEQGAVGQPGQRIVVRHVVDLRVGGQLFGGVFGNEQHVVGLAFTVLAEQGAAAQGAWAAGRVDPGFGGMALGAAGATGQLLFQVTGSTRCQAFAGQLPGHAALRPAEQAFGLLVGQQDALAFQVLDNNAGGDVGNHRIKKLRQLGHFLAVLLGQFLGLQQFQLLPVALGNVAGDLGETHQLPGIVVHRVDHHMGMEGRAVLAQARTGLFEAPGAARLLKVERGQPGGALGIGVEQRVVLADDFLGQVALGALGAGVPVGDDTFGGEQVEGIVHHTLDQQPVHDVGACD